ncbi:MAG: SRPBCC family protein [Dehalococcoidia bacterium]
MSVDVQAEIVINRPRDDVAGYAMNPGNDPIWISGIIEANPLTELPLSIGTRVKRVARFLGKRMDYTLEVVEYDPRAVMVMRTSYPFEMMVSYEFEERGGSTLARIHVQGEGTGFYRLAAPLLSRMVKRSVAKDLEALKRILESETVKS